MVWILLLGKPRTQGSYDSIWVIVDQLTKVAHFILVKTHYKGPKLAQLYMEKIVCLHGVPKKIVFVLNLHLFFGSKYIVRWEQS